MKQRINRKQVCGTAGQYYFLSAVFAVAHSFFFATYSAFLASKGLSLFEINMVSCFFMAGGFLSRKFMMIVRDEKRALILSQGIAVAGMLAAGIASGRTAVLAAILFHAIGRGMLGPIKRAYVNKCIPSEQRATILLLDSMVLKVGAFVGLPGGGLVAERYSISAAWVISAIVLAVIIPVFLKLKNGDEP